MTIVSVSIIFHEVIFFVESMTSVCVRAGGGGGCTGA